MNGILPEGLFAALSALADGAGSLRAAAESLHLGYAKGAGSQYANADSARAYAVTRMPATAAAVLACLRGVAPHLASCISQLDLGSGTGAALWAARQLLPDLTMATAIERDTHALACASALWELAPGGFLPEWRQGNIPARTGLGSSGAPVWPMADLVTAAYAFSELPEPSLTAAVDAAWAATSRVLLLVEPGTPAGFRTLLACRTRLFAAGAHALSPCPHAAACPMTGTAQWCHQMVRLPRSAQARAWKGGRLGFEDEKFCHLAVSRTATELPAARIIATPHVHKAAVELRLCTAAGLQEACVPRRDPRYRQAQDLTWGACWPEGWDPP